MLVLLALASLPARAAPPDVDPAVVIGDDLVAWRALTAEDAEPTAADLRAFIDSFPSSPLAESALVALEALGPLDPVWARENQRLLDELRRSRATHEEALARQPVAVTVPPLDESGDPHELTTPWMVYLHAGAALDDQGAAAAIGARLGWGSWAAIARVQAGHAVHGELAVRLAPASWGVVFLEAGADTRPRGIGRLGVSTPLTTRIQLESSLGVGIGPAGVAPVVRLELAWGAELPPRRRLSE